MGKKKTSIICVFSLFLSIAAGCKKDENENLYGCWDCNDPVGNYLVTFCGNGETNVYDSAKTLNGGMTIDQFRTFCHKK